jgi:Surface antigen
MALVEFHKRTKAPSESNKYYIKTTYHGYNKCILINELTGSVLPNCTGYAWGRFMECQNNVHDCELSRGNAENWYGKDDGYQRGRTPKLGAVICWSDSDGAGHVAIVEKVYDNGDVDTSNSAYGGSYYYNKKLKEVIIIIWVVVILFRDLYIILRSFTIQLIHL